MLSENGDVIKTDTTRPLDRDYPKWQPDATDRIKNGANVAGRYASNSFEHVHLGYKSVFKTDTVL